MASTAKIIRGALLTGIVHLFSTVFCDDKNTKPNIIAILADDMHDPQFTDNPLNQENYNIEVNTIKEYRMNLLENLEIRKAVNTGKHIVNDQVDSTRSIFLNCNKGKVEFEWYIDSGASDHMGWNDVGFHGTDQIPTPNIDALAYNGIILNSHYCQSLCTPSRAAFLTGKYPIHTGMQHIVLLEPEPRGLPLTEKLLPEYLKEAGYSNHAIGKWHLGFYKTEYTPLYRGFDSHYGYWNGLQDYYNHVVYATFNDSIHGYDMRRNLQIDHEAEGKYSTTLFTEEAVKVIHNHNTQKPMFMYLSHLAPHSGNKFNPMQAPDEEIAKFAHIPDPDRRIYAAMVSLLDDSIGKVVAALREKRMLENSIILFLSDNGAQTWGTHKNHGSNYPLRGMKTSAWEGGHRVPALIWSPLLTKSQHVSEQMMHISDWMPTLFSAAGISPKNLTHIDGIDMWEAISRGTESPRTEMVYNIDDILNYSSIRRGDWKYLLGSDSPDANEWYGDSGRGPQYRYDPELVLKSHAGVALTGFITDMQSQEKKQHGENAQNINYTHQLLTSEKIWELRNKSTIVCQKTVDITFDHKCDPYVGPCLFNIREDPCEQINLASDRPVIVKNLENAIAQIRTTIVPASNIPMDANADPALWGGNWVPWQDCEILKKKVDSPMTPTSYAVLGVLCTLFFIVVMVLIALSVKSSNNKKKIHVDGESFDLDGATGVIHVVSDNVGDKGDSFQDQELCRHNSFRNNSKNIN